MSQNKGRVPAGTEKNRCQNLRYTTRKDNAWAKANPDEIQQMYIMSSFHTATEKTLKIHLMDHLYPGRCRWRSGF